MAVFCAYFGTPLCQHGRGFARAADRDSHMDTHDETRRFLCGVCGASDTRANNLARHELTHAELRQFLCGDCGASATSAAHLASHELTHDETRQFLCGGCGASATRAVYLARHSRKSVCGSRPCIGAVLGGGPCSHSVRLMVAGAAAPAGTVPPLFACAAHADMLHVGLGAPAPVLWSVPGEPPVLAAAQRPSTRYGAETGAPAPLDPAPPPFGAPRAPVLPPLACAQTVLPRFFTLAGIVAALRPVAGALAAGRGFSAAEGARLAGRLVGQCVHALSRGRGAKYALPPPPPHHHSGCAATATATRWARRASPSTLPTPRPWPSTRLTVVHSVAAP